MTTYGYARVSTTDQDLTIQQDALRNAGCTIIRSEKVTGTKLEGRKELATLLEFLQSGDVLVITRLDRLARSMDDLTTIVRQLEAKGVELRATEQPIDTTSPAGKAFFQMLGVFAEFETNLRKERQLEGIAKAKAAGVYKGRKPSLDVAAIKQLRANGMGPAEIAKRMGVARSSVYRVLDGEEAA
ncbi:recombinase family protein [Paracoccus everestensis]|uniref:recombinase family protein n=1 Tax=Paracoccus everestensis TaxID=2903900 RepID=UPI001F437B85|nr:recombinase family protein [Paracoccus everestensis]